MVNLNFINIAYLFFRLAPFVIVCFFVMDSVINNSIRGLVYLAGLLIGCFFTILVSGTIGPMTSFGKDENEESNNTSPKNPLLMTNEMCNSLTLGENGPLSKLPLSQTVFAYTLSYLLVLIADVDNDNSGIMLRNIPMIVLFGLLILADFGWNMINKCVSNPVLLLIAGGIGAGFGVGWASVLTSYQMTDFYYVSGTSTKEICSAPTKKSFKCWKSSSGQSPTPPKST